MELVILGKAIKDMKTISKIDRENISNKIKLASGGDMSNIKKLTNHNPKYRLRVGDYRVLGVCPPAVLILKTIALW